MNIADHAITAGQSAALIMSDGDVISYGELYSTSQRIAAVLHDAGLRRGDGVALVLPNRREFFEITWGCQLSGLYYTAVNTHFTPEEVSYVIDDCDAKAVFVDASMADLAAHLRSANAGVDVHIVVGGSLPGWQSYDDAVTTAGDAPLVSDGSEMLYSSGTTGRPKAVRRALPTDHNGSWAQSVLELTLIHKYGMSAQSVYLSPAPMLRLIETHRVTHAQFVPTMFVRMLKLPEAVRRRYDVSSLAENLLVMHPKLVDAAVFGVPNDEFGEEVKAVVEPVDGVRPGPDLEDELVEYCRTHLAGYKCPRTIEFDILPRDPNGKLYKRRIRERYWQGRASRIV